MESIKYGKIVVEIQQKGMIHMATKNRLICSASNQSKRFELRLRAPITIRGHCRNVKGC